MPITDYIIELGDADDMFAARNQRIAQAASERVAQMYPGYSWVVEASCQAGMINVRCPDVSEVMGYQIPMKDVADMGSWTYWLMRAGGEILERANMPREGIRPGSSLLMDAKLSAWKH